MNTYLFSLGGLSFYEDEKYGDDECLLVKWKGKFFTTGFYDKPSWEEADDLHSELMRRGSPVASANLGRFFY